MTPSGQKLHTVRLNASLYGVLTNFMVPQSNVRSLITLKSRWSHPTKKGLFCSVGQCGEFLREKPDAKCAREIVLCEIPNDS